MDKEACIFCKVIKKEIPSDIVFENNETVAFNDIHPQAPVHIIVIPKQHIERVSDLADKDANLTGKLVLIAKRIAKEKGIEASGYRIVMNCNKDAGQAVFHLHLHLLGGRLFTWPPG